MNLAQLIDPQWVQDRFPERVASPRVEIPPTGGGAHVVRFDYGEIAMRIRKVLAKASTPLTNRQISVADGKLTPSDVGVNIAALWRQGEASRAGDRGSYRYLLTAKGRRRLA